MATLPARRDLEDRRRDARDAFVALRTWAKERRAPGELAQGARDLDAGYRQAVFAFLLELPERRPIFRSQAKELLKTFYEEPSWRNGSLSATAEAQVAMALGPPSQNPTARATAVVSPPPPPPPQNPTAGATTAFSPPPGPPQNPAAKATAAFSPPPRLSPSRSPAREVTSAEAPSVSPRHASGPADSSSAASTSPRGPVFRGFDGDSAVGSGDDGAPDAACLLGPEPLSEEADVEAFQRDIFAGMPPPEAFAERSRHDAGDTFKDFRKWARRLAFWDLDAAGYALTASVRRDIFRLVIRMADRRIYIRQVQEVLSMLLSVPTWVAGENVVDGDAVDRVFGDVAAPPLTPAPPVAEEPAPEPPVVPKAVQPAAPPVALPPSAKLGRLTVPPAPPRDMLRTIMPTGPAVPAPAPATDMLRTIMPTAPAVPGPAGRHPPQGIEARDDARLSGSLRARVEAALAGGIPLAKGGEDLVDLYQKSGLGGQALVEAKAPGDVPLPLVFGLTMQRLKDLFIDPLQQQATPVKDRVHFPHLYIDLQKRSVVPIPRDVQASIERKIRRCERWTSIEKAHALCARHEQTVRYVLAYAVARAKAEGRDGGVWIPLGMKTGSQGHANAVCIQARPGSRGAARVLVYDPNYNVSGTGSHWVHALKAISDALPGVQKLLSGTGVAVESQAELFGHGLQTALGTTSQSKSFFSRIVVTTHRGYPICGSVVFLLGSIWTAVGGRGGRPEDVMEVEETLAAIVADGPAGKAAVQGKIAQQLEELTRRLDDGGTDPFAVAMRRKLNKDKKEWPETLVRAGWSLTIGIAQRQAFVYKW